MNQSKALAVSCAAAAAVSAWTSAALCQCTKAWLDGPAREFPSYAYIYAMTRWQPTDSGQQQPVLLCAGGTPGSFVVPVNCIGGWNGDRWTNWSAGLVTGSTARTFARLGDGTLVAGGSFNFGLGTLGGVAVWNGRYWSPLGSGGPMSGIRSVCQTSGGGIAAAGSANQSSTPQFLYTWNGSTWQSNGSAIDNIVNAICQTPDGSIYIGGTFTHVGVASITGVARFQNGQWSALGSGLNGQVAAMLTLPGGDLIVGGSFTTAGGVAVHGLARWNGSQWSAFGPPQLGGVGPISTLALASNGDLLVGGPNAVLYRLSGTTWTSRTFSSPYGAIRAIYSVSDTEMYMSGISGDNSPGTAQDILELGGWFGGDRWYNMSAELEAPPRLSLALPNGEFVVAGNFKLAGPRVLNRVAVRSGDRWLPLGPGLEATPSVLKLMPDGRVVAIGQFPTGGGAYSLMQFWNGNSWQSAADVPNSVPRILSCDVTPSGDIVAASNADTVLGGVNIGGIARWHQGQWQPLPQPPGVFSPSLVIALADESVLHLGAGRCLRFDGGAWSDLSIPGDGINSIAARPGGGFFAEFASRAVRSWNANTGWTDLTTLSATGSGLTTLALSNSSFVIASGFLAFPGGSVIGTWNGEWSAMGSGIPQFASSLPIISLSKLADSSVLIATDPLILSAGGRTSRQFAVWGNAQPAAIAQQPTAERAEVGGRVVLRVAATGTSPLTYQWRRNGITLVDTSRRMGTAASELIIQPVSSLDGGVYDCIVNGYCGTATTAPAQLIVPTADVGSAGGIAQPDGGYDNNDFVAFISLFFASDPRADLGRAGGLTGSDGAFDSNDFIAFINMFFVGR